MSDYCVSFPTGNDSATGTSANPFRTINRGLSVACPGDTVQVRGGTYHECVYTNRSGSLGLPITLRGYEGERPILDGWYALPDKAATEIDPMEPTRGAIWDALFRASGSSHIVIQQLEVIHSKGRGILTTGGTHISIVDCWVHDCRKNAIDLWAGPTYSDIASCRVWRCGDLGPYDREPSTLTWPLIVTCQNGDHITFRDNTVFNNWGEGIGPYNSTNITVEDNTVYDNWGGNIWITRTQNLLVQRNLVYDTNIFPYLRKGNPPGGIGLADEVEWGDILGGPYTIINNLVMGCKANVFWCSSAVPGTGIRDSLIANNTLVNALRNPNCAPVYGILINSGTHSNNRMCNNIVIQDAETIAQVPGSGFTWLHNVWSRTPPVECAGEGDIIGNPMLALSGPTGAGKLSRDYFRLLGGSPAIGAGASLVPLDCGAIPYGL